MSRSATSAVYLATTACTPIPSAESDGDMNHDGDEEADATAEHATHAPHITTEGIPATPVSTVMPESSSSDSEDTSVPSVLGRPARTNGVGGTWTSHTAITRSSSSGIGIGNEIVDGTSTAATVSSTGSSIARTVGAFGLTITGPGVTTLAT